jgi:DNA gyrase/topoisomerase IV subunit B
LNGDQALRWFIGWKSELIGLCTLQHVDPSSPDYDAKKLKQQVLLPTAEQHVVTRVDDNASAHDVATGGEHTGGNTATTSTANVRAGSRPGGAALTAGPQVAGRKLKDAGAVRLVVCLSPAAEKIVDEILQNTADRCMGKDPMTDKIEVWVDDARGVIRVKNNGHGIPITVPDAAEYPKLPPNRYWPTHLFSEERVSGNFCEVEGVAHHQGGCNGLGAKSTNICSKRFKVTVGDCVHGRHFVQEWRNGMTQVSRPTVTPYSAKVGYVEVEFEPDMGFFNGEYGPSGTPPPPGPVHNVPFTPAFAAAVRSRVWEIAAITPEHVSVHLDGVKLPVRNLTQCMSLFHEGSRVKIPARSTVYAPLPTVPPAAATTTPLAGPSAAAPQRLALWDMTVLGARDAGLAPGCIAFVNGVRCNKGKHVMHAYSKLAAILNRPVLRKVYGSDKRVAEALADRNGRRVTAEMVRDHTFIILSTFIDGPRFGGQNKDSLDSLQKDWGFEWNPLKSSTGGVVDAEAVPDGDGAAAAPGAAGRDGGDDDNAVFCKRVITLCADAIAQSMTARTEADFLKEANGTAAGNVLNIPKYEAATEAGRPNTRAELVLAEGLSAKNLVMEGRSTKGGTATLGAYCLKGVPRNTRGVSVATAAKNKVLNNVARILGLEHGKEYTCEKDLAGLNYRHIVLLADQDVDGGHIVGLIVNWQEDKWPSLLRLRPDFIKRFATPIVIGTAKSKTNPTVARDRALAQASSSADRGQMVARRLDGDSGSGSGGAGMNTPVRGPLAITSQADGGALTHKFLSLPQFNMWLEEDPSRAQAYTFQYYKGLGSHTNKLAREYFANREQYMITLWYDGPNSHDALMDMFHKSHSAARQALLQKYSSSDYVDYSQPRVSIPDYLRCEVLPHSFEHNRRNIPGVDGLKWTQRKLLWASLKKQRRRVGWYPRTVVTAPDGSRVTVPATHAPAGATAPIFTSRRKLEPVKLMTLGMQCAEMSQYHHGDVSLYGTMVGIAQAHVGTNGINLLSSDGQMGNRYENRQEYAAPRYLYTGIEPISCVLFPEEDDDVLCYHTEAGQHKLEPTNFWGLIPIDFVNGCNGVGSGKGSRADIPAFNPVDVINMFRARIKGEDGWRTMVNGTLPWYDGFVGPITETEKAWCTHGMYYLEAPDGTPGFGPGNITHVVVTEIPVGLWISSFQKNLETLLISQSKAKQKGAAGRKGGASSRGVPGTTSSTVATGGSVKKNARGKAAGPAEAAGAEAFPRSHNDGEAEAARSDVGMTQPKKTRKTKLAGSELLSSTEKGRGKRARTDAAAGDDAVDNGFDEGVGADVGDEQAPDLAVEHKLLAKLGIVAAKKRAVAGFIKQRISETTASCIKYTLVCDTELLRAAVGDEMLPPLEEEPRLHLHSCDPSVVAQARRVYAMRAPRYPLLEEALGLVGYIPKGFLNRFNVDTTNLPTHYNTIADIVEDYYHGRMRAYEDRIERQKAVLQADIYRLENRVRFLTDPDEQVTNSKLHQSPRAWWKVLEAHGYLHDTHVLLQHPKVKTVTDLPLLDVGESKDAVTRRRKMANDDDVDNDEDSTFEDGDDDDNAADENEEEDDMISENSSDDEDGTRTSKQARKRSRPAKTGTQAKKRRGGADSTGADTQVTFHYLTGTKMHAGTRVLLRKVTKSLDAAKAKLAKVEAQTPAELWLHELSVLEAAYTGGYMAQRMDANAIDKTGGVDETTGKGKKKAGKKASTGLKQRQSRQPSKHAR